MRRFEREVKEIEFIDAMLKQMGIVTLCMNDEDGYPYAVPLNFGHEIKDNQLLVYIHFSPEGKKVELLKKDNRVSIAFSIFNDFPDKKYKGHYHDYRSVLAKGKLEMIKYEDNPEVYERGYNLLYTCNNRAIKPLGDRKVKPVMYIGVITCDLKDVTAKSEFPIRSIEAVPFINVSGVETDETPFDISDIIAKRKAEK